MTRQLITICLLLQLCIQAISAQESITPTGDVLPNTKKLELTKPLHEVMVHGISQFAEQELQAAREKRTAPWLSAEDVDAAKEAARGRLREMIGAIDTLVDNPIESEFRKFTTASIIESTSPELVNLQKLIRWDTTEYITGQARAFRTNPIGLKQEVIRKPIIIFLGDPEKSGAQGDQLPAGLAVSGAKVIAPYLVDRNSQFSMHSDIRQTNMTHREYVYRLGFNLGHHIIGYEVERTLALIHLLDNMKPASGGDSPIVLVGVGEGAVIAQYVAALAPDKVDTVVLHGYFGPRENVWQEPIYRNVWKQLTEFSDAEIASLIAPTPLIIEAGKAPEVTGPPEAKKGQAAIAAPGVIKSPELADVKKEFERAKSHYTKAGHPELLHLVENPKQVCGPETIAILNKALGLELDVPDQDTLKDLKIPEVDEKFLQAQQKRLVGELVRHTQMLLARSDKVRAKLWKDVDRSSVEAWEKQAPKYREMVYDSFIGKLDTEPSAPNPRSRKVIDEPTHVGYEVVMDLYASKDWSEENPGVIAGGILLLPKDLKEGEQRPVVVCQHGLEGVPMDTITLDESQRAFRAYKGFATQLVKRGFIVYAPQNPYKGYDEFRVLQRKSNPLGRSLFSYIIPQHRQTLNWLGSLNYVDPERIAFYGLSYGGKTAVRVPPMLMRKLTLPKQDQSLSQWQRLKPTVYAIGSSIDPEDDDSFDHFMKQENLADLKLDWTVNSEGENQIEYVDSKGARQEIEISELGKVIEELKPRFVSIMYYKNAPEKMEVQEANDLLQSILFKDRVGRVLISHALSTGRLVHSDIIKEELIQPGYCLSICSADFNEWIRKNASAEDRYSYIYTPEYEIFEWNMGHIANYAELSWLMAPRPFMVERGHDDGVAPDEWVGWEYAKVRRHYTKLGIKDKTEIEWFDGPHTINGDGTFKFLHKHLNWPERE